MSRGAAGVFTGDHPGSRMPRFPWRGHFSPVCVVRRVMTRQPATSDRCAALLAEGAARKSIGRICRSLAAGMGLTCVMFLSGCSWMQALVQQKKTDDAASLALLRDADRLLPRESESTLLSNLKENPRDFARRRQLAELLLAQNRPDEAVAQLERIVLLDEADVETRVRLAGACRLAGQTADARRHLESALAINPSHRDALVLKGDIAESTGQVNDALEAYHQALAVDSSSVVARLKIAGLLLRSERGHQAAPLLRSVCACDTVTAEETMQAEWMLGLAYGHEERWTDAVEVLSSAIQARGTEATADDWYCLAYAHYRSGDRRQSWQSVSRALSLHPRHPDSLALAKTLQQEQTTEGASLVQTSHIVHSSEHDSGG